MNIDDLINSYFQGKYLVLYRFEWVENRNKKGDFKEIFWKTNIDIDKFNFKYPWSSNPMHPGIKWKDWQLETLIVERFEFKIIDVYLQDYEDWNKGADFSFTLEGFSGKDNTNQFCIYSNDNLEIIEK